MIVLANRKSAFTLIELLVVIALIGLLIAIALPSLQKSRAASQEVVCKTNIRQLGMAAIMYAQDNDDKTWPVNVKANQQFPTTGGAWARLPAPGGKTQPGLMYQLLDIVDTVGECPKNRRTTLMKDSGQNMFGGNTPIDFDYTMVANTQGVRLDRRVQMGYLANPEKYAPWSLPPATPDETMQIIPLSGLAIFTEENTQFFNQDTKDGLWSNADMFETRHGGRSSMAFLEGHVESFKPIMGKMEKKHEAMDMDANDMYVRRDGKWTRMELQSGTLRPYGWINTPKP